jgi:Glycosyltransferases involved in cell wall biogenesis
MTTIKGGKRLQKTDSRSQDGVAPKISVVTVVRNGAATIGQTIESVLSQSWRNKEYIIIDGGSTDGTIDIIRRFDDKIDFWISEPDKGIFDAMNKGIESATGDVIGILNADDWYEPEALSKVAKTYIETNGKAVIHGMLRNFLDEQFYAVKGNSIKVLKYDMIQHPTCFIPQTIYKQFGGYNHKFRYSADYDFILKLVNHHVDFHFVETVLTNFRLGGASSTQKADLEMIEVMKRNHLISPAEAWMRKAQARITFLAKSLLRK